MSDLLGRVYNNAFSGWCSQGRTLGKTPVFQLMKGSAHYTLSSLIA